MRLDLSGQQRAIFIGGALHGKPVPVALEKMQAIRAVMADGESVYRAIQWWQPNGSLFFFVSFDLKLNDMTGIIYEAVHRTKHARRQVSD